MLYIHIICGGCIRLKKIVLSGSSLFLQYHICLVLLYENDSVSDLNIEKRGTSVLKKYHIYTMYLVGKLL